jgi:hypothetical protein
VARRAATATEVGQGCGVRHRSRDTDVCTSPKESSVESG